MSLAIAIWDRLLYLKIASLNKIANPHRLCTQTSNNFWRYANPLVYLHVRFQGTILLWASAFKGLFTQFGSSDFAERCNFNRNPPIFSNSHHWRQLQLVMFSRLCKYHFREQKLKPASLRCIYTCKFCTWFRIKVHLHWRDFAGDFALRLHV